LPELKTELEYFISGSSLSLLAADGNGIKLYVPIPYRILIFANSSPNSKDSTPFYNPLSLLVELI
jgi:hypothetical protein